MAQHANRQRFKRKASAMLLGGCLFAGIALAAQNCPDKVQITFFDHAIPPYLVGTGPKFEYGGGTLVKWVQAAVASTGCKPQVEMNRRPVRRAYIELEIGKSDLLAPGTATEPNMRNAVFPVTGDQADTGLSFLRVDNSLWVRKIGESVSWDGNTLSGPKGFKLGVPGGTLNEAMARERGWEVDVGVNGALTTAQLLAGRFPVALVSDAVVLAQPTDTLALLKKLTPPVSQTWYYSPASKDFYAAYPGFVRQYWQGLCEVARADKTVVHSPPLPACAKSTR